ncbi:hypothetical protein [Consotaella salsifontis]|uniref:DUF945 domain-containing protein n=1 Tax=Consotaella salsifontis TaxID=1365950 RepID=A0A1T4P4Y4_9HYPH|nr:hypothetical protein [Consotaella salsifontis]SJZ85988.1 hypothetical protein SAMN05428963_103320 [Consotaella salsifontis]
MKTPIRLAHLVTGTALLLVSGGSALAADANAFASRLTAVLAKSQLTLTYSDAKADGDDVILSGASVAANDEKVDLGDLTFSGVEGSPEEGYTVAEFEKDMTGKDWSVEGLKIQDLTIAGTSTDPKSAPAADVFFSDLTLDQLEIKDDGRTAFTTKDAKITNTTSDSAISSEFDLGTIDMDVPEDSDARAAGTLREIGYDHLSGNISGKGSWTKSSGELTLQPLTIKADDAGTFNFSYKVLGYTPEFIASLSQLRQQMQSQPEGQQAAGMAVMGLMAQLQLSRIVLSYEDDSLANRLLDFYAKKAGQPRDQYVQTLTGSLSPMLASLKNPDFQKQIEDAVSTFLKDPKSLSIQAEPAQPIAAAQIMGAAMAAPQTIPTLLEVKVEANQPVSE